MSAAHAFGDRAILVAPEVLGESYGERARTLAGLGRVVAAELPEADVVVGGTTLLVVWNDGGLDASTLTAHAARLEAIVAPRAQGVSERRAATEGALHQIAVFYDGADLAAVAVFAGLSIDAVVALHSEQTYTALVAGFLPGFAYLGEVDPRLAKPRLATPRVRVPAGSVGVAGSMTGVYPFASPGGWNLLGRAIEPRLFDPTRTPARRIAPMDRVRFVPLEVAPVPASEPTRATQHAGAAGAALRVVSGGALATVQDRGRAGRLGEGIPRGGALDLETLALANAAVDNANDAAAIEIPRGALVVEACGALVVSVDGAPPTRLANGARLEIPTSPRRGVRYLAVRGGVDVPIVLGSRATLLVAGLGGLEGRRLCPGDVLAIGGDVASRSDGRAMNGDASLRVAPRADDASVDPRGDDDAPLTLSIRRAPFNPDLGDASWEALLQGERRVSNRSDRVGTRLDGPRIPRHAQDVALPEPVLPGAVQITTDGGVVVLGPDAAVTGGYPIAGVLEGASLARLGRAAPGRTLRFVSR